jgi:hypothetical protein
VFNATFSNISAISWRPVLVMQEAGVPEERKTTDHGQATDKHYYLRLRVECALFCNLKSRSCITKTDRHEIAEILLQVALNTKSNQINQVNITYDFF